MSKQIQIESSKICAIIKGNKRNKGVQMVLVATQVKRRRGTTAENDAFTGAEGEITVDLTKKTLRVHDGSTQGGTELAKSSDIYTQAEIDDLLSGKSSTDLSNITATGKEVIAHNSMPSSRYVDLALGASGATYTAPADGYLVLKKTASAVGQYIQMINTGTNFQVMQYSPSSTSVVAQFLPVSEGDTITIYYNFGGTTNVFRFFYANGAQ